MSSGKAGAELLHLAQTGNLSALKDVILENYRDKSWAGHYHRKSGDTVMTIAARYGHLELLQFFKESKLDYEISNFDGKRALHEAAQSGHGECVNYLISENVKVDSLKRADWTPLMLACTKRNISVIEMLVDAGADLTLKNKDGWNCFHIACREGDAGIVKYLLSKDSQLWNTCSKNGRTPLHTAALHGCVDVVDYLMRACSYVMDTKDSCGVTPLMDALRAGFLDCAELLLKHECEISQEDSMGRQSVHVSAEAGQLHSVQYLLEQRGVPINGTATNGLTALHYAAKEGKLDVINYLIKAGCDVNVVDNRGRIALHMASGGQYKDCVVSLLQAGSKDVADTNGNTAYMLARSEKIQELFHR